MTTTTPEENVINTSNNSAPINTTDVDKPLNVQPTPEVAIDDPTTSKPAEDTALIDDSTNLQQKVKTTSMGPTAMTITYALSVILLCFLAIISIIPLLQLIFGLHYSDKCPINRDIPGYLIVTGAAGLIGIGLHMIMHIHQIYVIKTSSETSSTVSLILRGISIIILLLMIFLFCWFIAGCIWVFRVWNKVQYKDRNESNYCHPTLYRFAYWMLILSVIYQLFTFLRFFIYGYSFIRGKSEKNKKDGVQPVPTTET